MVEKIRPKSGNKSGIVSVRESSEKPFSPAFPKGLNGARQRERIGEVLEITVGEREPRVVFPQEVFPRGGIPTAPVGDLTQPAREGDSEAFGALYGEHVDQVRRHICYRVGNNEDADDLTSQVFHNAWRAYASYQDRGKPIIGWLLSIARNLVVDFYRARKNQTSIDNVILTSSDTTDPAVRAERALDREVLHQAMLELKPRYRRVIKLRFIDELELHEISAIEGIKEVSVRVRISRAVAKLKKIMEKDVEWSRS